MLAVVIALTFHFSYLWAMSKLLNNPTLNETYNETS